jgi:hypothetical protein
MDLKALRHDILRNVGCLLSGTEMLSAKEKNLDTRSNSIIKEMNRECKSTLSLLEDLFNKLENNKGPKEGGNL